MRDARALRAKKAANAKLDIPADPKTAIGSFDSPREGAPSVVTPRTAVETFDTRSKASESFDTSRATSARFDSPRSAFGNFDASKKALGSFGSSRKIAESFDSHSTAFDSFDTNLTGFESFDITGKVQEVLDSSGKAQEIVETPRSTSLDTSRTLVLSRATHRRPIVDITKTSKRRQVTPASTEAGVDVQRSSPISVDVHATTGKRVESSAKETAGFDTFGTAPSGSFGTHNVVDGRLEAGDRAGGYVSETYKISTSGRFDTPNSTFGKFETSEITGGRLETPGTIDARLDTPETDIERLDIPGITNGRVNTPETSSESVDTPGSIVPTSASGISKVLPQDLR